MKFHRIDIQNINSLFGENTIDIDAEFADTPLYLIMGPTGSGKTTILDAVCLALFGTTPRQVGADGGAAGIGAQVNSRGTGRSRARVVFSLLDTQQGKRTRYRATWEFWRAHDKAYATPQTPRRELERLDADGQWKPIVSSTKEKEYQEAFDRVLDGMTLDDFLRSVMLAQGEFSALLKADDDEKASILERLTDTGDYQRLGRLAHERWRKERDKLGSLEQQIENFEGASPEQIAATEREVDERRNTRQELVEWKTKAATRSTWLERHLRLKADLATAASARKEAAAKKEEHADEFEQRDADRRASGAREPLKELRRIESNIEALDEKIPKLEAAKAEQDERLERAKQQEKAAIERLEQAEKKLEAIKPEIEAAKAIKGDLKNAEKRVDELEDKAKTQQEALDKAKQKLEEARAGLEEAKTQKEAAAEKLGALTDDEGLSEELPALRAQYESLQKDQSEIDRAAKKVEELDRSVVETAEKLEAAEVELDAQKEALAPLRDAAETARQTLQEHLGEADLPRERYDEISDALQRVQRRQDALEQLEERLAQLDDQRQERDDLCKKRDEVRARKAEVDEAVDALHGERDEARETVDDLRAEVDQLGQKLLAAELRRTLHQGQACPVCGGQDHPRVDDYGADALDEQERRDQQTRDALLTKVEAQQGRIEELDERLEARAEEQQKLADELTRLDTRLEAADDALEKLDEAVDSAAEEAGAPVAELDFDDEIPREALAEARSQLDEERGALEQQKSAVAAAQDAVAEAAEKLQDASKSLKSLDDARKDLERTLDNARGNHKDAAEELARLHKEFESARERLSKRFAKAGIEVARGEHGPDFDAALEHAGERVEAYKDAQAAVKEADEALAAAEGAHKQAQTEHEHAKQNLAATSEELDAAKESVTALQEALAAKLDGEDPDAVEKAHADTIQAARKAREEQNEARQKVEMDAQAASDALAHAQSQREQLGEEVDAAKEALDEAIAEIDGMSTIEQVDAALLDDDDERKRIEQLCDEIETTLRDAKRDIAKLEGDLEEHGQDKPDEFDPEDYSLEILKACEQQLDEAIGAYDRKLGALEQELEYLREQLGKYRDLLAQRDEQEEEFDEWNELNDIIGVRNGERFKQFAQALNLDRIVERANHRLMELHPRYRLKTKHDAASGLPTLDFEIVDNYHAGKPRDLSTLSGGETFLVSLALALALADQQEIQMPIETLFLDEGFGTLDKNSLRKAIDILNDLHTRAGRTVGVISHVEALQERIASQIIVTPEQEGRSSVVLKQH